MHRVRKKEVIYHAIFRSLMSLQCPIVHLLTTRQLINHSSLKGEGAKNEFIKKHNFSKSYVHISHPFNHGLRFIRLDVTKNSINIDDQEISQKYNRTTAM